MEKFGVTPHCLYRDSLTLIHFEVKSYENLNKMRLCSGYFKQFSSKIEETRILPRNVLALRTHNWTQKVSLK